MGIGPNEAANRANARKKKICLHRLRLRSQFESQMTGRQSVV